MVGLVDRVGGGMVEVAPDPKAECSTQTLLQSVDVAHLRSLTCLFVGGFFELMRNRRAVFRTAETLDLIW